MLKNNSKPIQKIAIISLCIFSIVIIAFIITFISRIGKIPISVHYAPFNASLSLDNGQKLKNNSINYIAPGDYKITASLEHFESKIQDIIISTNSEYLLGTLLASDADGEALTQKYQDDFRQVEGLYGNLANLEGQKNRNKYPILNYLPINNNLYSISYFYNEVGEPMITIKAEPEYQDIAVKKLYTLKNVNPSDYSISFKDSPNPFQNPILNENPDPIEFIRASFKNAPNNTQVASGIQIDNYYITTIYTYDYAKDLSYAHYRVILEKSTNTWKFATTPELILTTKNSSNIPTEILIQANQL